MLYGLSGSEWVEWFLPLRLFQYITFRAFGGGATAFLLTLLIGPALIRRFRRWKIEQIERDDPALARARGKQGTPMMGGVLILAALAVSVLLWTAPGNRYVGLAFATAAYMGLVGFWDDYLKLIRRDTRGLNGRVKLALEIAWAAVFVGALWSDPASRPLVSDVFLPFIKDPFFVGLNFPAALIFSGLVIVGCVNAVNLTDGLDGLAIGCSSAVSAAYLALAYVAGHAVFARYLLVPFVPGAGELAVFCGCLLGAGLGFLWFNCHPARIFMGDTGSLAVGGAIAAVAILIQQELTLFIVGGVFVIEALSVMAQVVYFKLTGGRRIFRCAPIHHHFEQIAKEHAVAEGRDVEVTETMVTIRFWILGLLFALIGVATLKIR